jgi:hypothetical protein
VLSTIDVKPDFEFSKPEPNARIEFVHRKLAAGDLYFVANRQNRNEKVDVTFRVAGKAPEIWRAETGQIEQTSYKFSSGRTTVPLTLEPWGTVFVVFRKAAAKDSLTLPEHKTTELTTLDADWKVDFQGGRGAPSSIQLNKLASWTENADTGVKYFSGTGTYTKTIEVPAGWFKSKQKLYIDLGDVMNLADVTVNGKYLGQVWHAPFTVDATSALHPGSNTLVVKVTNAWVNRLIGDAQPDVKQKVTFTVVHPYKAKSKLLPSGLLGPVRVFAEVAQ